MVKLNVSERELDIVRLALTRELRRMKEVADTMGSDHRYVMNQKIAELSDIRSRI